jgi:hypothetical protein
MRVLYVVPEPKTPDRTRAYNLLDEEIQPIAARGIEAYVLSRPADRDADVGRVGWNFGKGRRLPGWLCDRRAELLKITRALLVGLRALHDLRAGDPTIMGASGIRATCCPRSCTFGGASPLLAAAPRRFV